jgi:hypothetical protein
VSLEPFPVRIHIPKDARALTFFHDVGSFSIFSSACLAAFCRKM